MSGWFKKTCSPSVLLADIKSPLFWRDVFLECVAATTLLTCIMLVLVTNNEEEYKKSTLHIGIAATLLVFVLFESFSPVGEINMDPAISIALFIGGRITLTRTVTYIIVQVVAAPLAAGVGYTMTPEPARMNLTALNPSPHMTLTQSIMVEAFLTFLLLYVVMSVTDGKNHKKHPLPGLAIGSVIGLGILLAGTHSGGLLNPIVSLATACISGNFNNHVIYWIGPVSGGVAGASLYNLAQLIRSKCEEKTKFELPRRVRDDEKANAMDGSDMAEEFLKKPNKENDY